MEGQGRVIGETQLREKKRVRVRGLVVAGEEEMLVGNRDQGLAVKMVLEGEDSGG